MTKQQAQELTTGQQGVLHIDELNNASLRVHSLTLCYDVYFYFISITIQAEYF